jgi:bifunctional non-homologous end joining protein LigD
MILPAPMLAPETLRPPFTDPAWIYEIKFDGYRCMAVLQAGRVELRTKSGADCTAWFPEVTAPLAKIPGTHVIDGEACVLDEMGVSDFDRFQDRARRRRWYQGCDQVTFCAFDLLAIDGRSIIGLPLETRKEKLAALLKPALPSVLYVGHFEPEHGRVMFEQAVHQLSLEGLVAKRLGSLYRPGERSPDWVKVKRPGAVSPERFVRK